MPSLQRLKFEFQKVIQPLAWLDLVRICLYPITTLFTTPVRLIQFLWDCRVLLDGRWGKYPHFLPHTALNSLFYWTRALDLHRFGRAGHSPYTGLGNKSLSLFFFYSVPSLYAYWIAGAPTVLVGMLGWWALNWIWLGDANRLQAGVVIGLALISTTFYSNLARQNYNAVGWIFFPLGLYGLATGNWMLGTLAWVLAQWGSVTVVFLGGVLSLIAACSYRTPAPILSLIPASLFVAFHFWPFILQGDLKKTLLDIAKAIGLVDRQAKYPFKASKALDLRTIYFLLLYTQFIIVFYFVNRSVPLFFLSGIFVFLLNSTLLRFADPQSLDMFMLSLGIYTAIVYFHPLILASYWLTISPIPRSMMFPVKKSIFMDIVPALSPFDIQPFLEGMQKFLAPVQNGQRIFMAFDDPRGVYENIYGGYRVLLELPLYVSAVKEVHFMPDWWAVFELNYEGAPDFWGRNVEFVQKNALEWQSDYVIVYQDGGTKLALDWQGAGFRKLGKFSWSDYAEQLQNYQLVGSLPDWWLLQVPRNNV